MKRALVPALIVTALLPSCERVWTVTGVWAARSGKYHTLVLDLRQEGDAIRGMACEYDIFGIIKGVPVAGTFPHLSATVEPEHVTPYYGQSRIGMKIVAEVVSRDSIGAQLLYPGGHMVPYGFKRDAAARCPVE